MRLARRRFLRMAAATTAFAGIRAPGHAEEWPSRPVRLIVGAPAKGGSRHCRRSSRNGCRIGSAQPFVVENRPGAAAMSGPRPPRARRPMATCCCYRAAEHDRREPLRRSALSISPATLRDRKVVRVPRIMEITHRFRPRPTRIHRVCQGQSGKVRMASGGTGSGVHLGAAVQARPVLDLHVPYRDTMQALDEADGRRCRRNVRSAAVLDRARRAAKLRALAVSTVARSAELPECRASPTSCRVTRAGAGSASAHRRARRPRSS